MTALTKLRDQIAIARSTSTFVVLTPDEAQAVVDEADLRQNIRRCARAARAPGGCPVCGDDACPGNHPAGSVVASGPPYEAEDEHV